ncbi:MAG: hypothetical protein NTX33_12275 [Propionibacteriales bacterium]|nr:hypothetical protein [Propionibacteriales bacterium]
MGLVVAAALQLVLGMGLFRLGRWGRLSADAIVPARMDAEEHRARADSLARGALFCQAIGSLLVLFAIGTAVAAMAGAGPTLRPQ